MDKYGNPRHFRFLPEILLHNNRFYKMSLYNENSCIGQNRTGNE